MREKVIGTNDTHCRKPNHSLNFIRRPPNCARRTLDALLATPLPERKQSSKIASSSKDKAGEELVAAHRSILSSMLAMVKNEMVLVNKVDCDRDGLDEYLSELEDIQSTHLDLITKLRGALNTYVTAAESSPRDEQFADDDSFEDLRD